MYLDYSCDVENEITDIYQIGRMFWKGTSPVRIPVPAPKREMQRAWLLPFLPFPSQVRPSRFETAKLQVTLTKTLHLQASASRLLHPLSPYLTLLLTSKFQPAKTDREAQPKDCAQTRTKLIPTRCTA